ncbi:hybrid sensor histidine kinase/response regulator [Silvanigrella aquatica]|uniref:histidine kinase n=1 Tax=Silvanigrella aquatica TaxID=1915309 RepID=A0A1L4CZV5_9BACT|nr:hybrid sensor histidine kinase/response regulator [Silvanigrella aquatica]APJ03479.1 hypothetical protein AXG55_05990 [Silvanigrella aquatica]
MKTLKNYIYSQSKKQIRFVICTFIVLISMGCFFVNWFIYTKTPKDIINSLSNGIGNSIVLGDFFSIQKEFSSLIESKAFDQIILKIHPHYKPNEEIEISNIGKKIISSEHEFILNKFIMENLIDIYYYKKFEILLNGNENIGNIYIAKKIDLLFILSLYCILLFISLIIFIITKRNITNTYRNIASPIFEIESAINNKTNLEKKNLEFIEFKNLYSKIIESQEEIKKSQDDKLKIAELSAITSTIQMLAHDVRQPFSRLKMSLELLKKSKSHEDITKHLISISINTNRDILRVEYFLNEMLQGRNNDVLKIEEASLLKIISNVLKICFDIHNNSDISIEYDFLHSHKIKADIQKLERVFSNIVMNAIQAIPNKKGKIWIFTKDVIIDNTNYIEICLGNNNSYIEDEDIDKIFDLFFTKGKRKGTGLGLAISKQIIQNHGGNIYCKSCKEKGVEFFIYLPTHSLESEINYNEFYFPNSSKLYENKLYYQEEEFYSLYEKEAIKIENKILKLIHLSKKKTYSIFILEDDPNYLQGIISIFDDFKELSSYFKIHSFDNYNEAIENYTKISPEFLICDIDLNDNQKNGFDFIKKIREEDTLVKTCVHSNRFIKDDISLSAHVNSDFFIPKPMTGYQMLNFLYSYFIKYEAELDTWEIIPHLNPNKDKMALILDDDKFYLELWKEFMNDINLFTFHCPETMYDFLRSNISNKEKISCIISDFYIDDNITIVDLNLSQKIKEIGYDCPLFVCTNAGLDKKYLNDFDGILKKMPCSFSEIQSKFKDKFCS